MGVLYPDYHLWQAIGVLDTKIKELEKQIKDLASMPPKLDWITK